MAIDLMTYLETEALRLREEAERIKNGPPFETGSWTNTLYDRYCGERKALMTLQNKIRRGDVVLRGDC